MIPYARLRPGPGFSLGRTGFYYAQRLATHPVIRRSVSRAVASVIRLRHDPGAWPTDPRFAQVPSTLQQQGIAMLPGLVGPDAIAGILAYLADKGLVGPGGRPTPLADLPPSARMAGYPLRTLIESPAIMDLVNAVPVLRIAAAYLGCKPTLSSLGVRWSFPGGDGAGDTQQFHRDPDDWRFLKLFVYLSDVDAGSGPHVYVPRSHRTMGQVRARPYAQSEIERRYGKDGARTVLGPQGTAFMADTYGIHAGMVPARTPRMSTACWSKATGSQDVDRRCEERLRRSDPGLRGRQAAARNDGDFR